MKLTKALREELELAHEKSACFKQNPERYLDIFNETIKTKAMRQQLRAGFNATVIFAQYECGTGICIESPMHFDEPRILTCAHCLGERGKLWSSSGMLQWQYNRM